jgi:DNA-binding CsgD family transcriptional regulator
MKSKPQLGVGELNKVRLTMGAILALLFSYNLIIILSQGRSIISEWYLLYPFLLLSILLLIINHKIIISITFVIIGIYSSIDNVNYVDYSGSIFFILAFYVYPKTVNGIIILMFTLISISVRAIIQEVDGARVLNLLLAYGSVYSIFYILILKKKNHILIKLNKSEYERIKLYSKGMTTEEINDILKLNIDPKNIRQSITKARDKFECKNDIEFTIKLLKMQELSLDEL